MTMGLSLENLAQVLHADRQCAFGQERFVRQVELAQAPGDQAARHATWWTTSKSIATRQLMVTVAVRPFQLTVRWV